MQLSLDTADHVLPRTRDPRITEFRQLYRAQYGFVWSVVRRLGVRPDRVDDAVQDTFLTVFRRLDDLPALQRRAWLYGIARRISSNYRRAERRRTRKLGELRHLDPVTVGPEERWGAGHTVARFLEALSTQDRELFVLAEIEGFTGRELAAALQAKSSTLYDRLRTLRGQLRRQVGGSRATLLTCLRRDRPDATASRWALLLPRLGLVSTRAGLGAGPLGALTKATVAVGALAAGVGLVVLTGVPRGSVTSTRQPGGRPEAESVTEKVVPKTVAVEAHEARIPGTVAISDSSTATPTRLHKRTASPVKPVSIRHEFAADDLAQEAAVVERARHAIAARDFSEVRGLAAEHERRFSPGALADAMMALRIEALCGEGRWKQAHELSTRFLRTSPTSPVSGRIRRACLQRKSSAEDDSVGVGRKKILEETKNPNTAEFDDPT